MKANMCLKNETMEIYSESELNTVFDTLSVKIYRNCVKEIVYQLHETKPKK